MKAGFCWNSRRWIVFMFAGGGTETCPLPPACSQCDQCGYYEEREVTKYYKRKEAAIKRIFEGAK